MINLCFNFLNWCAYKCNCFISFSDSLVIMCRNTTDFYILILYIATLLNSLTSSNRFWWSLEFSIQNHVVRKQRKFYFFLSKMDAFYFFVLSIAVTRTYSTLLNSSGDSGHICLVPDFRRKSFILSPLSMLAMGLVYMPFVMLRYVLSILTLLNIFITKGCWVL